MSKPLLILNRGESLAAWALSPVMATPFPGIPAPAEDSQNYKYINGFVDVGDLPCRVATWRDVATRTVTLDTSWPVESLYLPGANRRVEFSQFRSTPTRLARWCRTSLSAPVDRYCSFRLSTRGGVHIWVDGEIAARFEPFTRNSTEQSVVHLPIKAAGSDIVVLTEDMAERDTNWFFELTLLDDVPLAVHLPGAPADAHLGTLKALAAEVRPAGEFTGPNDPLVLEFDTPASLSVAIHAKVGSTSHAKHTMLDRTVTLNAGETKVTLCRGDELPEGYHILDLTFIVDDTRVSRQIACAIIHDIAPQPRHTDIAERKREALLHSAREGEMRMGTALAMLAAGLSPDQRFRDILEETLTIIEERWDCADFISVPLLWAFARHADQFPADLRARTETALLNFRYWVDEPGNDVMWFWSENHALCFHVSQLMAGQIFPDGHFTAANRNGNEQARLAAERLHLWFDAVEAEGLAEWNSSAYYPVDFIGVLALVEFAPTDIAARARRVTDRIFTMMALHTLGGVPAGSMGRAYDKELRAGPLTELAPFATVAFGKGWLNQGVASLPMFAAGSYLPPPELGSLAWPEPSSAITAHYTQGYDHAAHLSLFKTPAVQLSSNAGAKPGGYGHQQHVVDVLFSAHPLARSWINHPGEDDPWGSQRPSYWAGNGVLPRAAQHENIAFLLYDLGSNPRLDFTHAYVSQAGVEAYLIDGALILRSGNGLLAYKATAPLEPVTKGPSKGREYRCYGRVMGWVALVAEGDDIHAFARRIAGLDLSLDGRHLTLTGLPSGSIELDWTAGLSVDGKAVAHPNMSIEPLIQRRKLSETMAG
ncbi:hypothetical protein ACI3KW_07865 [Devosia sp. ZW T5_3]|uniref:hypothetical protein n=1 Tax=Devosia sp. ZW T5_3 TaxID=3378085 RepID=UPI0038552988